MCIPWPPLWALPSHDQFWVSWPVYTYVCIYAGHNFKSRFCVWGKTHMVFVFLSLAYFNIMISSSKQFFFQASWFHFSLLLNEILLCVFCIHSSADVRLGWLLHQLAAVNSKAIRMCARSTGEKILETQWRLSTLCLTAWNTKDFILRIFF